MKAVFFALMFVSFQLHATSGVKGVVQSAEGCSEQVMVWLSLDKDNYKERLLLMHTEVPKGGSFQFYLKPGNYQVRASDKVGCEFLQKITIKDAFSHIQVKLVKK